MNEFRENDFVRDMFLAQFAYLYRRLRAEPWVGMDQAMGCWTMAKFILRQTDELQPELDNPPWQRILAACWETYRAHELRDDRNGFAAALTGRLIASLRPGYAKFETGENARAWFGCFRYDYYPDPKSAYLHIRNAAAPQSPFADMEARRRELRVMVEDIERKRLQVERVHCASWINGLKPFQELFPPGYADSFEVSSLYTMSGYGWWGQLITKDGRVNPRRRQMVEEQGQFEYPRVTGTCAYTAFKKHLMNGVRATA